MYLGLSWELEQGAQTFLGVCCALPTPHCLAFRVSLVITSSGGKQTSRTTYDDVHC